MAKVFVTGATGFIGRYLVERLIQQGDSVCCLVRPASNQSYLRSLPVQTVTGNIAAPYSYIKDLMQADTVYHLAAALSTPWRKDFYETNAHSVGLLAEQCAKKATPPVFMLISSLAASGPAFENQPKKENDRPQPISHYGKSKLAGELAAAAYAKDIPMTIIRPPTVFGGGDLITYKLFWMAKHRFIINPSLHMRSLSLIHAQDLVECIVSAAKKGERLAEPSSPYTGKGVYFAASPEQLTLAELGQIMGDAFGPKKVIPICLPGPIMWLAGFFGELSGRILNRPTIINIDKTREALAGSWICDGAKAKAELGFQPTVSISERLIETALWYQKYGWL